MGIGSTVWQGSAFECLGSHNEIVLRHSLYNSSSVTYSNRSNSCNNGGVIIVAQIIGVSENTYTSKVTISDKAKQSSFIGKTVECFYDNGATAKVVVRYNIPELFINDTSKY